MISVRITRLGAVDSRAMLSVPLSAGKVWGQIRGFHTFARQEFFHDKIVIQGGVPRVGARLNITHRFFLFRARRVGRICRWKEGHGFAFSDLSVRGAKSGFPHIFSYRIHAVSDNQSKVEIRVAGRWTASAIPRWMAWIWIRWIMQFISKQVENRLLVYQVWLVKRKRQMTNMALVK